MLTININPLHVAHTNALAAIVELTENLKVYGTFEQHEAARARVIAGKCIEEEGVDGVDLWAVHYAEEGLLKATIAANAIADLIEYGVADEDKYCADILPLPKLHPIPVEY